MIKKYDCKIKNKKEFSKVVFTEKKQKKRDVSHSHGFMNLDSYNNSVKE